MRGAKLRKFDDTNREDHYFLRPEDDCYYFIEFTARKPYSYSAENGYIANLKKSPLKRNTYQWPHKVRAMNEAAQTLFRELPNDWLADSTFVPIPPSKAKDHPEYDDRMLQILSQMQNIDVRELVYQEESMDATHVSENRHSINTLAANYRINEELINPPPTHIVIIDDMMTAGAHYRAMRRVLRRQFPGVPISGVFIARRVFPKDQEDE